MPYPRPFLVVSALAVVAGAISCSASGDDDSSSSSSSARGTGGAGGEATGPGVGSSQGGFDLVGAGGNLPCEARCSTDLQTVVDCNGNVVETCMGLEGCDASLGACGNACDAAVNNRNSVGCSYYATDMANQNANTCFAAFVANTWGSPARLEVARGGQVLPIQNFARIPQGTGPGLTYAPYDPNVGLPPGEVAILFLSGNGPGGSTVPCPVTPAVAGDASVGAQNSGIGASFAITSDVPVVAYQINPFGGGSAAVTGASLLLPTSVWDGNYIGVNAYGPDLGNPSMNIVAAEDDTTVTILPVGPVAGGAGVPTCAANTPCNVTLNAGQNLQLSEATELTGSVVSSDKPVGLMAGHPCMRTPIGVAFCDHGEQMIPPVPALGTEYVGVMYRPRRGEPAIWRVIGAVDGTELTYSNDVGGPATLQQGEIAEFITGDPFVVTAQDDDHPFLLLTYMSGSTWNQLNGGSGYGDVDFVISVPPDQYLNRYVFFTDPTYPETNLVVVRSRDDDGNFRDVSLDCAGVLTGWQPIGDYEWTRVDLVTGDFQGVNGCNTGRREIESDGRFGLWVWGWGTPETSTFTSNVSYGYPGGMNVQPINDVVVPPIPK
ncbi:MAG: IgGFc-binding protein [Myxococcota bacterium]